MEWRRWSGGDAVTDAERKAYAKELILACRRKGLGAIAVPDHHDFAFFPYIRRQRRASSTPLGDPFLTKETCRFPRHRNDSDGSELPSNPNSRRGVSGEPFTKCIDGPCDQPSCGDSFKARNDTTYPPERGR